MADNNSGMNGTPADDRQPESFVNPALNAHIAPLASSPSFYCKI